MNNIINFLCLPDNDIEVTNIEISGDTKVSTKDFPTTN